MINRRQVLQREPPYNFVAALREIRTLTGWGSADLCFVLNVARGTLWHFEKGSRPNVDDGDAIRKLLGSIKDDATRAATATQARAQRQATCDAAYRPRPLTGTSVAL